jgi:hypothetical protein
MPRTIRSMSASERVHRRDFAGAATKVTRTPQGGLRLDAAITRVGVLTYQDHTGKSWREYKPAEEVFRADALATLEGAPVTELHPEKLVDGDTWKAVSVGHLVGAPRRDGAFVVAPIAVQDAGTAARVESRELHDVSAGYTCRVDWTAGVTPEGEAYDAVQRDIVYNHAALGPEGWGRAGTEVSLRMDGAANQVRSDAPKGTHTMKVLKVGGREYKLDAAEDVVAAQGAVDETVKKADAESAELTAVKEALMEALKKVAALEAKQVAGAAAAPPVVTEEMVPEAVADALAEKRAALRENARKVLGPEVKLDGLKATEIHKLVVAKALPTVKLDNFDAKTVEGMYLASVSGAATTARADNLRGAHPGPPVRTRNDAADDESEDDGGDPAAALNARTHNRFDNRGRTSGAAAERA